MIDVFSVVLPDLAFQPTMHVHYGEKVLAMRDGLPKFKDFPRNSGLGRHADRIACFASSTSMSPSFPGAAPLRWRSSRCFS